MAIIWCHGLVLFLIKSELHVVTFSMAISQYYILLLVLILAKCHWLFNPGFRDIKWGRCCEGMVTCANAFTCKYAPTYAPLPLQMKVGAVRSLSHAPVLVWIFQSELNLGDPMGAGFPIMKAKLVIRYSSPHLSFFLSISPTFLK